MQYFPARTGQDREARGTSRNQDPFSLVFLPQVHHQAVISRTQRVAHSSGFSFTCSPAAIDPPYPVFLSGNNTV